ncbi:hypothetical protein MUK42_06917 [Musa troglodytarum]|uniref:Uncharacterized protein n=1 Tax=Musa troglodytarum TaxID=320322 RepID=A0A9E7KJ71_9LILI|nr:hypothetical protein MUK42_06917 [Musa troglodytarum]
MGRICPLENISAAVMAGSVSGSLTTKGNSKSSSSTSDSSPPSPVPTGGGRSRRSSASAKVSRKLGEATRRVRSIWSGRLVGKEQEGINREEREVRGCGWRVGLRTLPFGLAHESHASREEKGGGCAMGGRALRFPEGQVQVAQWPPLPVEVEVYRRGSGFPPKAIKGEIV